MGYPLLITKLCVVVGVSTKGDFLILAKKPIALHQREDVQGQQPPQPSPRRLRRSSSCGQCLDQMEDLLRCYVIHSEHKFDYLIKA